MKSHYIQERPDTSPIHKCDSKTHWTDIFFFGECRSCALMGEYPDAVSKSKPLPTDDIPF